MKGHIIQWLLSAVWLCVVTAPTHTQVERRQRLEFKMYAAEQGLWSKDLTAAVQDATGTYWLADYHGIHRFNGESFQFYPAVYFGLPNDGNLTLLADAVGMLWVVSYNANTKGMRSPTLCVHEVVLFDPVTRRVKRLDDESTGFPFAVADIYRIQQDRELVLVTTFGGQAYSWDGHRWQLVATASAPISVLCRSTRNAGDWWMAVGLDMYKQQAGQLVRVGQLEKPVRLVQAADGYVVLYEHSVRIPLGHVNYAIYIDAATGSFRPIPRHWAGREIHFLSLGQRGQLWVKAENELWIMEPDVLGWKIMFRTAFENINPTGNTAFFGQMAGGHLWLLFDEQAVCVNPRLQEYDYYPALAHHSIRGIEVWNDSTLVFSSYSGTKSVDIHTGKTLPLFSPKVEKSFLSLYGVAKMGDTLVFGSHEENLFFKTPHGWSYQQALKKTLGGAVNLELLIPFTDRFGGVWIGTREEGLYYLAPSAELVVPFVAGDVPALNNATVQSAIRAIGEGWWLSTSRGLYLFDPDRQVVTDTLGVAEGLEGISVTPVSRDSMWVVPYEDDPFLWDRRTGRRTAIDMYRKQWRNSIHAMVPDGQGGYWLPTNNGLYHYHPASGRGIRINNEDRFLPSTEFNRLSWKVLPDGRIALGGLNGMMVFRTAALLPDGAVDAGRFPLTLQGFQVEGGMITHSGATTPWHIPPQSASVQFPFEHPVVSFTPLRYYYRLAYKGQQGQWHEAHNKVVTLNTLSPGEYTIELAYKGEMDAVLSKPISQAFVVVGPWFLQAWALVLWAAILVGLGLRVNNWRVRRIRVRQRELEQIVAERTATIHQQNAELNNLNQAKDKLFALIGHELRVPMFGVIGLGKKAAYLMRNQQIKELEKLSQQIDRFAWDTQAMLENLLAWGKTMLNATPPAPTELDVLLLLESVEDTLRELVDAKAVSVHTEVQAGYSIRFNEDALRIVLRNLLHNALKFSESGTHITISAHTATNGTKCLAVADQGPGFPASILDNWADDSFFHSTRGTRGEQGTGLGLRLCQTLAVQNGGRLHLKNRPSGGGEVVLEVGDGALLTDVLIF